MCIYNLENGAHIWYVQKYKKSWLPDHICTHARTLEVASDVERAAASLGPVVRERSSAGVANGGWQETDELALNADSQHQGHHRRQCFW